MCKVLWRAASDSAQTSQNARRSITTHKARIPSAVKRIARLSSAPGVQPSWPALPYRGLSVPEALRLPIDHLFARGGPLILDADTGPALGSDHLPVLATVALPVAQ